MTQEDVIKSLRTTRVGGDFMSSMEMVDSIR